MIAAADGSVEGGNDHVQEGGCHPLQLLYETLILTIQLSIVALALTGKRRLGQR